MINSPLEQFQILPLFTYGITNPALTMLFSLTFLILFQCLVLGSFKKERSTLKKLPYLNRLKTLLVKKAHERVYSLDQIRSVNFKKLFKLFFNKFKNISSYDLLKFVGVFLLLCFVPRAVGGVILEALHYPWIDGYFYPAITRVVGFTFLLVLFWILAYLNPNNKLFYGFFKSSIQIFKKCLAGATTSSLVLLCLTFVVGPVKAALCMQAGEHVLDQMELARLEALRVQIRMDLPQNLISAINEYRRGEFFTGGTERQTSQMEKIYLERATQAQIELRQILACVHAKRKIDCMFYLIWVV